MAQQAVTAKSVPAVAELLRVEIYAALNALADYKNEPTQEELDEENE